MKGWSIFAAILIGGFLMLWLPVATLRVHNIGQRAVVTATATDHRVVRRKSGWREEIVVATLSFMRPQGEGSIACRLESFEMGLPFEPGVYDSSFEIAVHPQSCYEPERLPLKTVGGYFVLTVVSVFSTIAMFGFYSLFTGEGWMLAWMLVRSRRRADQPEKTKPPAAV